MIPAGDGAAGRGAVGDAPVLVMVSGYSRVMTARMIPSRQGPDLWAGMGHAARPGRRAAGAGLGQRVRGRLVARRAPAAHRGDAVLPGDAGDHGDPLPPEDPEAKALVERANGYLETSFMPGRNFTSPADLNAQLADWLPRANRPGPSGVGGRPVDLWHADRAAMLALPPVAPAVELGPDAPGAGLLRRVDTSTTRSTRARSVAGSRHHRSRAKSPPRSAAGSSLPAPARGRKHQLQRPPSYGWS